MLCGFSQDSLTLTRQPKYLFPRKTTQIPTPCKTTTKTGLQKIPQVRNSVHVEFPNTVIPIGAKHMETLITVSAPKNSSVPPDLLAVA